MIEDSFKNAAGLTIFTRAWEPEGSARAVVAIVHGFNSHSGYYIWAAERLAAAGLSVVALDLRGRGRSDGERFYVDSFDDYEADVGELLARARARAPGLPLFLLGHSAGGVVACLYAQDHAGELAGLICESFAYELPAPDFVLAVLKGLSHLAPHAHVLRLKNEDFSRDPAVVAAMNADPLIADETQPTRTLAALVGADQRLKQGFAAMTLPLLILHGTADKAAKPQGSRDFHAAAGSSDKTLKLYDGTYHDPLSDIGKDVVISDIIGWIDTRLVDR